MTKPMSNLMFRCLCMMFALRDFFRPRERILDELEIRPGTTVLDYGCGPGSYALIAAQRAGLRGKVFALDIQPLAVRWVAQKASERGLNNIKTICSDCATDLPDKSVNVVFLYDILHALKMPQQVLAELYRVLTPDGLLSCHDHHMKTADIIAGITENNQFCLAHQGLWTLSFNKKGSC